MSRQGRAAVLLALGATVARMVWGGGFGWFVQQRMKWPLAIAAVVLLGLGVALLVGRERTDRHDHDGDREHDGDGAGRRRSAGRVGSPVGWLLGLPLLALVAVAPTGLGAVAAKRAAGYEPVQPSAGFEPIELDGGPVALSLYEFLNRAAWDDQESLRGVEVVLEGLVVNDTDLADGFDLTRFMVSCCAADGIPLQVRVRGTTGQWADDTWVRVRATWIPPSRPYREQEQPWWVEAQALEVTVLPEPPADPYESPY